MSSGTTVTVGPSGGVVTSKDGIVTLDVPAGALGADVAIWIAPASGAPAGTIGSAYDLGPDGTTFAVPASLTIRFTAAELGSAPADQLEIAAAVGGGWQPSPGSIVDAAAGSVSVPTTHLSRWAIIPAASNPCDCHTSAWSTCCSRYRGSFSMVGPVCVCSGYNGDFDGFAVCYTALIGGDRVANFCSGCLRKCCLSNGGAVNRACDCDLGSSGSVAATQACSRQCFSSRDKVTVCAERVSASSVPCDSTSCPDGCCDSQGTCQVGVFDDDCGTGGKSCVTCVYPQTCGGGAEPQACGPSISDGGGGPPPSAACDSTSCSQGCCDNQGACQPGNQDDACGSGGQSCSTCIAPDTCGGGGTAQVCGNRPTAPGRDAGGDGGGGDATSRTDAADASRTCVATDPVCCIAAGQLIHDNLPCCAISTGNCVFGCKGGGYCGPPDGACEPSTIVPGMCAQPAGVFCEYSYGGVACGQQLDANICCASGHCSGAVDGGWTCL